MHVHGFGIVLLFPPSFCFHDLEQQRKLLLLKFELFYLIR